jgi:hypothetical protein
MSHTHDFRLGPTVVTSASLQTVGTIALTTLTETLAANEVVFAEVLMFAAHESAAAVYSEQWRLVFAVQLLAGPSYRLGAVTKQILNVSTPGSPVLVPNANFDVDINGSNLRFVAQADATRGTAKTWVIARLHPTP